jgi:hypothetical protein
VDKRFFNKDSLLEMDGNGNHLCHPFPFMHSVFDHLYEIPPGFLGGLQND